jgi:uncharacterized protein (DUF2225 family)/CheY-like chemotaxis protein
MARILVVDDSAVMRKNISSILTQMGHTVVAEAANGAQAHLMYRNFSPDLVTMDITMPGVNGIEAVRLIMQEYPFAKIIMVSALNQKNMVFEALELGAKHYLIKPVTLESMKPVIQKVLGVKPMGTPATPVKHQGVPTNTIQKTSATLPQSTPPLNKVMESSAQNTDSAPQQPFTIESVNNAFCIRITKLISADSVTSLQQATQGLLFVKPLNVLIDFGDIDVLPRSLLEKIDGIVKSIKTVGGVLRVVAQNQDLVDLINAFNIEGLSELITLEAPTRSNEVISQGHDNATTNTPPTDLFLPGHKHYSLESNEPIDNFVYVKKITCPVCKNSFEIQVIRFTKLPLEKVDLDFRQHYVGFEPLWYAVQVCPQCGYAHLTDNFDKITEHDRNMISQKFSQLQFNSPGISSQRDINQAFTSYYLALYWLKDTKPYKLHEAKLWLRLAWLYDDVKEPELSKLASEKALAIYKDLYQNNRAQTTVEQDQRTTMLLAELCVRQGLKDEALRYFRDTIVNKGGNKIMNEKARDRMHDIRDQM